MTTLWCVLEYNPTRTVGADGPNPSTIESGLAINHFGTLRVRWTFNGPESRGPCCSGGVISVSTTQSSGHASKEPFHQRQYPTRVEMYGALRTIGVEVGEFLDEETAVAVFDRRRR